VTLLCFDPALRTTGVALFVDGRLVDAYAARPKVAGRGPSAWGEAAAAIWSPLALHGVDVVVLEGQVIYPHAVADPNDVLQVAGVAGGLAAIAASLGAKVVHYDPAAWKGQAPKEVIAARSKARLSEGELAAVRPGRASTLDTWDAIGLGLHHLRLHPVLHPVLHPGDTP